MASSPVFQGCADDQRLARLARQGGPEGLRASLRLGWCRWQEGRTDEALALLDRAADHPTLSSYALLWAGQAALESRDPRGAVRRLALALQKAGPASLRAASHLLLAQARLQLAEPASAEAEAQKALRHARGDEERAAAWELLGRAAELVGRRGEAVRRYAVAWWGFPGTSSSRRAEARLRSLLGGLPVPPVSARLERARRLADPAEAVREWRAALRQGLAGPAAAEAWLRLGRLQLGKAESITSLQRASAFPASAPEARYWLGASLVRRGQVAAGVQVWEDLVARYPTTPWAARALWALARRAQAASHFEAADRWLGLLVLRFPASSLADLARWQRGWLRYRQARYREAEQLWLELATNLYSPSAPAALYWAARSRARQGLDPTPPLRRLASTYPHSYYGQRARQRLGLGSPPRPAESPPVLLPKDRFSVPAVELAALGFYREAAEEAEVAGRSAFSRRVAAWARARAGDVGGSVAAAEAVVAPWTVHARRVDAGLWKLAYPLAYFPLVERWARVHGLDPLLVLAVAREESRFRPGAVSPAGAVGLMQVLPSTAQGLDPSVRAGQLTDPDTNLRLGTAYLAGRRKDFGGDLVMALAAYNAGPHAARRFQALKAEDADEFVEGIPYEETRAYVKRVLESYGVYRWLYGRGREPGSFKDPTAVPGAPGSPRGRSGGTGPRAAPPAPNTRRARAP